MVLYNAVLNSDILWSTTTPRVTTRQQSRGSNYEYQIIIDIK